MSWFSDDSNDSRPDDLPPAVETPAPAPREVRGKAKADVWVQPAKEPGRWQVKREGASRASRVFDTQEAAETYARSLARKDKVEVKVAGRGDDPGSSSG